MGVLGVGDPDLLSADRPSRRRSWSPWSVMRDVSTPASGSVTPKHIRRSPLAICGRYLRFISSDPCRMTGPGGEDLEMEGRGAAGAGPEAATSREHDRRLRSDRDRGRRTPPGIIAPSHPPSAKALTNSQGYSPFLSFSRQYSRSNWRRQLARGLADQLEVVGVSGHRSPASGRRRGCRPGGLPGRARKGRRRAAPRCLRTNRAPHDLAVLGLGEAAHEMQAGANDLPTLCIAAAFDRHRLPTRHGRRTTTKATTRWPAQLVGHTDDRRFDEFAGRCSKRGLDLGRTDSAS